ncbi:uncharacterized protein METZ01_LOCUS420954 [marine metagenome]|uniref:Uncharacterized protein n=1 Tax=marine metagenome TaxID=408172 RepID=A0A382XB81_9ZZZZ
MAEQKTKDTVKTTVSSNGEEEVKFEPVKQIEQDTFDAVKGIKTFDYVIIGLLAYLVFIIVPDLQEKVHYVEKDLNSVLVQSERYKAATRVMSKGNACAECHLDPDHLISGLQSTYPSFADLKGFMSVGHQKYYTMAKPMADTELMEIYRTLK